MTLVSLIVYMCFYVIFSSIFTNRLISQQKFLCNSNHIPQKLSHRNDKIQQDHQDQSICRSIHIPDITHSISCQYFTYHTSSDTIIIYKIRSAVREQQKTLMQYDFSKLSSRLQTVDNNYWQPFGVEKAIFHFFCPTVFRCMCFLMRLSGTSN